VKKTSAIIFDLDGTLIDSSLAIVECVNYALSQKGLPPAGDWEIKRRIGTPLDQIFSHFTKADPTDLVRLYREEYRRVFLQKTFLLPGVSEVLSSLKARGYRLAVATTKPKYFAEPILEHLSVTHFFDAVAGAEEVERLKPAPDLLHLAMSRLRSKPDETFYVGDHPVDVAAANAAKVKIICVATGFWSRGELEKLNPTAVLQSLAELPSFLRTLADR
jgi:phosphoglycolate phosphatase